MNNFTTMTKRFLQDDSGATAIEYGLIVALIATVIVVGVTAVGTDLANLFGTSEAGVSGAVNSALESL